jgi:hypothetical protein
MSKSLANYLSEVRRAIPVREIRHDPKAETTAPITDEVDISKYRLVTSAEKTVIRIMLEQAGSKANGFLSQLEDMMVRSSCTCGCPSLAFAPPPESKRIDLYRQNIVAEMMGEASDGTVGLILWQAGGKLTGIEAYDLAGREPPTPYELPRSDTLTVFG